MDRGRLRRRHLLLLVMHEDDAAVDDYLTLRLD